MNKANSQLVFFIVDDSGFTWGVAPTKLQARVQIAWFLPRNLKLKVEPCVIPSNLR